VVNLLISAISESVWQQEAGHFIDGVTAGMIAVSSTAIAQSYADNLRPRAQGRSSPPSPCSHSGRVRLNFRACEQLDADHLEQGSITVLGFFSVLFNIQRLPGHRPERPRCLRRPADACSCRASWPPCSPRERLRVHSVITS
jgi:hypothetical protein